MTVLAGNRAADGVPLLARTGEADTAAVLARSLRVRWGEVPAVDDLDVRVASGSVTALLGPNGAGKSTFLSTLCALKRPDAGTLEVFGHDVLTRPDAVRRELGVVFQEATLDRELSVHRNLMMHARLYGLRQRAATSRVAEALAAFDLEDRAGQRVERLSGGLARRVEIARAFLHLPRLLVLDEPTVGLDPQARHQVWQDVRRLQHEAGVTVLYSTHYMDEAEHADHILILDAGRCVANGTPARLKDRLSGARVILSTSDDDVAAHVLAEAGFTVVTGPEGVELHTLAPGRDLPHAVALIATGQAGLAVHHARADAPSMDDVFLRLVRVDTGEQA